MSERTVAERIAALLPRRARWAYWQDGNGPMFVYNTERLRLPEGGPCDGKFESAIFEPYGPGSRSGKATRWRKRAGSSTCHALRRDAKARAWRLYQEHLGAAPSPIGRQD